MTVDLNTQESMFVKSEGLLAVKEDMHPLKVSKLVAFRRYAGAFFIYIVYWLTLFGAIKRVVGATLSPKEATELVEVGVIDSIWEYGWGDHYVWFLFVICFVTFCCAVLAGATAKKNGAIIASIANVPGVLLMILLCYFHYTGSTFGESPIAWGIVMPLSIICSIIFAKIGGDAGTIFQKSEFENNTILGIPKGHWLWIWLITGSYVAYLYSTMVCFHIIAFLIGGGSIFLMYNILRRRILGQKNILIRILAFVGVYIGGFVVGMGLQWLFSTILFYIITINDKILSSGV